MNSVIVYRLLRTLDAIKLRIEELRDAVQERSRTVQATEESRNQKEWPDKPLSAVIEYSDKTAQDTKAENYRQYAVQNSIRWATWCAFIAASIYAGIAALQLHQMRKATEATESAAAVAQDAANTASSTLKNSIQSFRVDERAWAEIGKIETTVYPPDPPVGVTFKFGIFPKNVGKTVARDVRSTSTIFSLGMVSGITEER